MHLFILSRKQSCCVWADYFVRAITTPVLNTPSLPSEQCEESEMVAPASTKRGIFTPEERNPEIINLGVCRGAVVQLPSSPPEGEKETSAP